MEALEEAGEQRDQVTSQGTHPAIRLGDYLALHLEAHLVLGLHPRLCSEGRMRRVELASAHFPFSSVVVAGLFALLVPRVLYGLPLACVVLLWLEHLSVGTPSQHPYPQLFGAAALQAPFVSFSPQAWRFGCQRGLDWGFGVRRSVHLK